MSYLQEEKIYEGLNILIVSLKMSDYVVMLTKSPVHDILRKDGYYGTVVTQLKYKSIIKQINYK